MGKAGNDRTKRTRRHVDDPAPFAHAHPGHKNGRHQKGAVEIDRKNLAPICKGHLGKVFLRKDAGAVHHDVNVAEFVLDLLRHGRDRTFRRDVALERNRLPAGGLNHFDGRGSVANIDDGNMCAVFSQALGECLSYPARRAGDDCDFILMALCHVRSPPKLVLFIRARQDHMWIARFATAMAASFTASGRVGCA
jgi:hypothetical protein